MNVFRIRIYELNFIFRFRIPESDLKENLDEKTPVK
jgi:hypothetical protein